MAWIKQKLQRVFDKNNPKQTLLNVVYSLFLLDLLLLLAMHLFKNYGYGSMVISEFLINYQGGFVRRGLIGEILFWGAQNFNINVEWTIKIACLLCFAAVCVFFIKSFLNRGYSLYLLPLSFFLGMGIITNGYWLRRDYLFICVFISIFWIYNKNNLPVILKFFAINFLFVFIILSHEVFAFFSLPILLLLLFNQYKKRGILQSATLFLCYLLPSLVASFFVMTIHGNEDTAQAIWNSWAAYYNLDALNLPTPLKWLGWTTEKMIKFNLNANFLRINDRISSLLIWAGTFPIVYYIVTNFLLVFRKNETDFTDNHKTVLSSILIFQFVCLFPLFTVLSCDYIRIYFYWISSSFAIFLLIPMSNFDKLFPPFFTGMVERINQFLMNILYPTKTILVFLMLCTGVSAWSGFSMKAIYASTVLYHILLLLSMPLTIITGNIH